MRKYVVLFLMACFACASSSFAKDSQTSRKVAASDGAKNHKDLEVEGVIGKTTTKMDFGESVIEGHFKAPQGFFIQGRQAQSLSQMVKLRSNFRKELYSSGSAAKALSQ